MATLDDVRRMVLSLPETSEKSHLRMSAFCVARIGFLSVTEDGRRVFLHADEATVAAAISEDPAVFEQVRRGPTVLGLNTDLDAVDVALLTTLIEAAWRHRAPKRLRKS